MWVLVLWFIFSIAVGVYAAKIQRSGFGWFLLALLTSPLIAGLLCLMLGVPKNQDGSTATHVKCPQCAELVLREARVCKHCGAQLTPQVSIDAKQQEETWVEWWATNKVGAIVAVVLLAALVAFVATHAPR